MLTRFVARGACSQVDVSLDARWKVAAGHFGPEMPQVDQIFRLTALLNPVLALTHPHIAVLLSVMRVCLAGQARPKPSAISRSGGCRALRRFAPAQISPGPCTSTACIAHLLSSRPLSGQCMGAVQNAWLAFAGTFTTFDRAPAASRIVARIDLACPACCNIIACDCR